MLVLSRKVGESIKLADDIEITVLAVDNQRVRLGVRAPRDIDVRRSTPDVNVEDENAKQAASAIRRPRTWSKKREEHSFSKAAANPRRKISRRSANSVIPPVDRRT